MKSQAIWETEIHGEPFFCTIADGKVVSAESGRGHEVTDAEFKILIEQYEDEVNS